MEKDNTPHLPAYKDNNGLLKAWCVYCAKWHIHGQGGQPLLEGTTTHRIAHCYITNSPYRKTGYFLDIVGNLTKELKKQFPDRKTVYCRKWNCSEKLPPLDPVRKCPKCGKENRKVIKEREKSNEQEI